MGKNLANSETIILFCDGSSCQKAGGENVVREGRAYLRNQGLWDSTHTIKTRCNGRCEDAPTCVIYPGNHWYKKLTPDKITDVLAAHTQKQEPIAEHLLFSDGWDHVKSDDERKPLKPKDFELKTDPELGECWITKGFSSDQYLYPLFQFIVVNNTDGSIHLKDQEPMALDALCSIKYEDIFALELYFTEDRMLQLLIGNIPNTQPQQLIEQKISATEYYYQTKSGNKGIRFKNKKGVVLGQINLGQSNTIWNYCLDFMLSGLRLPILDQTL